MYCNALCKRHLTCSAVLVTNVLPVSLRSVFFFFMLFFFRRQMKFGWTVWEAATSLSSLKLFGVGYVISYCMERKQRGDGTGSFFGSAGKRAT